MFEAWTLKSDQVEAQEEALRQALRGLSDPQRSAFYKAYNPQIKDPDTYATLNWCFVAGLHNFYLKQWAAGLFDLILMLVGVFMLVVFWPVGVALLVFVTLIELPALFRSQLIVADYNNRLGWEVLKSVNTHPAQPSIEQK
ncbi:hypothetical protein MAQ5080_01333 [Marinomonas aquimarina]|uniref:TM2 domain protein n=1 Tax=Marinomonas aquimarina TaxID=295068 RepID=A0A1A8T940_9GAMM|nr:hypothetical protein [Marinomonas aquimarina]SBS29223.1 hypothetical protein MAQ5080_01333 [Marinomonas aquimarina]